MKRFPKRLTPLFFLPLFSLSVQADSIFQVLCAAPNGSSTAEEMLNNKIAQRAKDLKAETRSVSAPSQHAMGQQICVTVTFMPLPR
jgi:hypothetical protein